MEVRTTGVPVIGARELRRAADILRRYKQGKQNLERRIIADEDWWKLRQWRQFSDKGNPNDDRPASGWLFNVIMGKHADAVAAYPGPVIRPREPDDRQEAQMLSSIIPCILEQNDFEEVYSDTCWQKMKQGTGVWGVYWDQDKLGGLGDIAIRPVNVLNLFWEPGVTDIQKSQNVFYLELEDNETLLAEYPQLAGKLGGSSAVLSRYRTDDAVDLSEKTLVVDWYYKKRVGGKTVLHYCKYVGETVLYATENDTFVPSVTRETCDPETGELVPVQTPVRAPACERGLYDDGDYPFIFDRLFPIEGSICGYGYIEIGKGAQEQIDRMDQAIVKNTIMAATPRWFRRSDGSVNEQEYADWTKPFVHVDGNLGQDSLQQVQVNMLPGICVQVLNNKIEELKWTTGNTDVTNVVDAASTNVEISLCLVDGSALTVSFTQASQPENPSNGQYWLDTSGKLHTLKQWAEATSQWVSVPTVYLKLSANGIGRGFQQYDGIQLSGLTGNEQIEKLNGSQILYDVGENYIVIVGLVDETAKVTSGTVKAARRVPSMDFITECGNRLWGCKYGVVDGETVNEIYCCKLGDFKNWECYQGVATDSWRASCGTDGKWTGAATLADSPVFFKEDCFHRVYPSASGAHQVVVQKCAGVQNGSSKSLVVVDDRLYYKSRMGVCVYDGSLPGEIGSCFGTTLYYNAVAGGVRGKYFISMEDEAHNWTLFVYDTRKGLWHKEDSTHAEDFARVDDELYFLEGGTLKTVYGSIGTLEGPVSWMAETGIMTYGLVGKKYVSRINLRMQLPKGSSVDFWVQYDSDGMWRHCGHIEGRGLRTFLLPIRPARCDHLKFRLTGKGEMKLFSLARVLEAGSDA